MAVKKFERALYCFEVALTTPSSAVSHIMLESYKKYILVSLLLHGKVSPLPKYTSQVVNRLLKPMSAAYHEIATVFATNKPASLEQVLQKHRDALARDNNWGLAKQVQQSLYKKIIQRLTQTFLTLSLNDMALRVQLPSVAEAEKLVLSMVFVDLSFIVIILFMCHYYDDFVGNHCHLAVVIRENYSHSYRI